MKKNIIKIINFILLTIIAIVAFIALKSIPNFLLGKDKTETINKVIMHDIEAAEASKPSGTLFEINDTTSVNEEGGHYTVVTVDGIDQIYCAAKGKRLNSQGHNYKDLVDQVEANPVDTSKHKGCAKPLPITSKVWYKKAESRKANEAEAFILTWPTDANGNWNDWLGIKQEAIWDVGTLSNNNKAPDGSINGIIADQLVAFANQYSEFAKELESNSNKIVKANKTVENDIRVNNLSQKEYVVGPFKIDYIDNGIHEEGLTFGGISDMYIKGENTERIEIKSFIIRKGGVDKKIPPVYFKFIDDKNLVALGPQSYPKSGEEFFVKYVAVQDGQTIIEDEQIDSLEVKFEWMTAESTITYYDGYRYKTSYTCSHSKHCHGHSHSGCEEGCTSDHKCSGCCYTCKITAADIDEYKADDFQRLLSADGKREKHEEKLSIKIPTTPPPPSTPPTPPEPPTPPPTPPPPTKNLQIKLAGHVWEEESLNKETLPDGKKGDSENWKAGVEVILHYEDGTRVTMDANRKQLINPYVTGEDGYYEFNDLDSKKKYYIEFVYDGQIYQATKYMANGGTNPEALQSNAKEYSNERTSFNDNFAQISSAPGNYKIRKDLGYGLGKTNTAYIVSKTSKETPYGIKEIYDYVVAQAIETNSYTQAYSNALSKFGDNNTTKSKLQFIEDCRISAFTNADSAEGIYPIYENFYANAEGDEAEKKIDGVIYKALYPKHLNIDFGLTRRQQFDLALRKDVEKATIEINGKTHTYMYDTRSGADENDGGTWDISVRLSDRYYDTSYSRELFASDYQYKASDYGSNSVAYGKTEEDELNVYVTYKLTVRNQSQSILGEVMEIVDYFDEDYEYVDERSYIEIKFGTRETDPGYQNDKKQGLAVEQTNQEVKATVVGVDENNNNVSDEEEKKQVGSIYGKDSQTTITGYNKLYITGLQNKKLTTGQTAYIYLTFKVKKDIGDNNNKWLKLDEMIDGTPIGVGKENIAEINGFKTYYRTGTEIPNVDTVSDYSKVAGLFDIDSVPGNINPKDVEDSNNIIEENFEDDTDKAPNIRLILYRDPDGNLSVRSVDGVIWEDIRTEINVNNQKTATGNGIKDGNEISIKGVTVQLVELLDNGQEKVWKEFSSGEGKYSPIIQTIGNASGNAAIGTVTIPDEVINDENIGYVFKSYAPGNYVVRFIYGDTVKTVLPNTSTEITNAFGAQGQNAKSYNGQDYKSTTYQKDITQNREYIWREKSTWDKGIETPGTELTRVQTFKSDCSNNETANVQYRENQRGYLYDITASDAKADVSDAKDIQTTKYRVTKNVRDQVIDYSDVDVTNYIAEVLASHEKMPLDQTELSAKLTELMQNTAMTAETGMMVIELEKDTTTTGNQVDGNSTSYKIQNVNLGLEERPKAQLAINKKVKNIKLTLADGSTLFDATNKATNVLWNHHKLYEFKYTDNKLAKDPMSLIREKNQFDLQYGLIQLTMDEELMHGATIKVLYEITVTNEGEVDYKDNEFYYTGITSNKNMDNVVATRANQVIDYVANNLQFYAKDNSAWQVINKDELVKDDNKITLVNNTLKDEVDKYNTVITTKSDSNIASTTLLPKIYDEFLSSATDELVLTQLITAENETDDLTYRNIVEIVKTSNEVGRRMAYSVVGNQNPNIEPTEVDSDRAEIIKILPPYGIAGTNYIIGAIIILSSAILIGGIIFIKKKVLK